MEIKILTLTDKASEARDYGQMLVIEVDGKPKISVYDGEPEDNNLSRNFNGVYGIGKLLAQAYDAGKSGEGFRLTEEKVSEY